MIKRKCLIKFNTFTSGKEISWKSRDKKETAYFDKAYASEPLARIITNVEMAEPLLLQGGEWWDAHCYSYHSKQYQAGRKKSFDD